MKNKIFSLMAAVLFISSSLNATGNSLNSTEIVDFDIKVTNEVYEDYSKCSDFVDFLMSNLVAAGAYDGNLQQGLDDWNSLIDLCDLIN